MEVIRWYREFKIFESSTPYAKPLISWHLKFIYTPEPKEKFYNEMVTATRLEF